MDFQWDLYYFTNRRGFKKLMDPNNLKTTLRYLHVTNKDLIHILSSLEEIDNLLKK